jgi:hypothetical protein
MVNQALVIGVASALVVFVALMNNTKGHITYQEQQITNELGVKIVFPVHGQRVPIGQLVIIGTSTDNGTSDCHVYVDWNDIKPFQNVLAAGPYRPDDYSTWTFSYTEHYHLIEDGANELTAKLFCLAKPMNFTKYYTINVTGIR